MMLFDIRNAIAGLFKNGFIKSLRYQSTKKPKSEESIAEMTKLRGRRLDEIAQKKRKLTLICLTTTLNIRAQVICTKD